MPNIRVMPPNGIADTKIVNGRSYTCASNATIHVPDFDAHILTANGWINAAGVEKNIALGLQLLALRSAIKSNYAFGRAVRRQFDIDGQHACEVMKVARVYGARPEISTRLSWNALVHLASPRLPAAARDALEHRIIAGERIGAPEIRAARGMVKAGKRGRQADHRAQRMAA